MPERAEHRFPAVDLVEAAALRLGPSNDVDPVALATDLQRVSQALQPVLDEEGARRGSGELGLDEVEVALTISAEGGIAFVARGGTEASIKLVFRRR